MTTEQLVPQQTLVDLEQAQWRIESVQMINWGGFDGRHEVAFPGASPLLSGASGTGKSTLLDAYLALMMPSDTPFNGASNDAGGRARSPEQRNLLTYRGGKMDTSRVDGSDELRDQVLRGANGEPIWGALGATFVGDDDRRYTVTRIYFAKGGAVLGGDVTTTFATFDGYLDLSRLESVAAQRFEKRALKTAISGLVTFNTFWEFEEMVHTRLGIGGGDGGRKAMRLLARVQAGMQVKRVDDLYKNMVLERPITYEVADAALLHFADLEASYAKMLDEAGKVKTLQRLPQLQDELANARGREMLIRQFGADVDVPAPSPFRLWRFRTERDLLDIAVEQNRRDHATASADFLQAKTEEAELEARLIQIATDKRANGGDAIDERLVEIKKLSASRDTVYGQNVKFQERTEVINLLAPDTAEQFARAQAEAAGFSAGFEAREQSLRDNQEQLREQLAPLAGKQRDLLTEKRSLEARERGMVPDRLHQARVRMAEAAGLDPMEDLPFVAELMDVLPDEEHWRTAIEATLGGIARTILVDRNTRDYLARSIDGVRISPRVRFQAVTLQQHQALQGDADYVSGKLQFKDSPFSRWVQDRVSDPSVDHLCVPNAAGLGDGYGHRARVTPSGQTRDGDRGAHGESGDGSIIGFSSARRLADIEVQLEELQPHIDALRQQIAQLTARVSSLQSQRMAHQYVLDTSWTSIDHLGVDRQIKHLEQEVVRLRQASSVLDELQAEEDRIKSVKEQANRTRVLSEDRMKALTDEHSRLVTEQDVSQDAIDSIERTQTTTVTETQQTYLDDLFAANWDTADLRGFNQNMKALRGRLREEADAAVRSARNATSSMESMFESFQSQWTEPNLGVTVSSADGYREILDRIQGEGLHERREKWRREFAAWSSDDLLRLNDAFDTALDDIVSRLDPINRILETLPFGGKGVLQINPRRLHSDDLTKFRRGLRELSSGLAAELTEQQVETRFTKLRAFMTALRIPEGHTKSSTSQRDRFLDVRQHVMITAICVDENHREVATYDSLGGKSGGETQELVAFIVGSALRYQLGDETRSKPRFAPVFLDEGFVKSDSEFAGRSVKAWQDLGFQLVIGAPLDKATALERHMNLMLSVTKSAEGYSYVREVLDANTAGVSATRADDGTAEDRAA